MRPTRSADSSPPPTTSRRRMPAWLGVDFLDGYRVSRITEGLAERDDWDVACRPARCRWTARRWRGGRCAGVVLDAVGDDPRPPTCLRRMGRRAVSRLAGGDAVRVDPGRDHHGGWPTPRRPAAPSGRSARGSLLWSPSATSWCGGSLTWSRLLREQPDGWFAEGWAGRHPGSPGRRGDAPDRANTGPIGPPGHGERSDS